MYAADFIAPGLGAAAGQPAINPNLDLETALQQTLQSNPDLVAARQNLQVSSAALAVARQFPTSLNPTVSLDCRPWVFRPDAAGQIERIQNDFTLQWSQPIELGCRTRFREAMAQAAFSQTQWNLLQTELAAVVQTYKLHQTASYRREKLRIAGQLAEFNGKLVQTLRRQQEANQATAADVALAEVEAQASAQQADSAWQDYISALTELRVQMGLPDQAGVVEPVGPPRLPALEGPGDEAELVQAALNTRAEIRAAEAQVASSRAAVSLAKADRIPIFNAGPVYEKNEDGASFYGFMVSSPVPLLNTGLTLVGQREAELHRDAVIVEQLRTKTAAQVKAALVKWQQARKFVDVTAARTQPLAAQADKIHRLYEAGQTEVMKLLQVRARLIELQNAQTDALWQATQAYADLLTALGTGPLAASQAAIPPAQPNVLPAPPPARFEVLPR